jgi:hypothetical protein
MEPDTPGNHDEFIAGLSGRGHVRLNYYLDLLALILFIAAYLE